MWIVITQFFHVMSAIIFILLVVVAVAAQKETFVTIFSSEKVRKSQPSTAFGTNDDEILDTRSSFVFFRLSMCRLSTNWTVDRHL